jgi:DNA-binding transcriptional LysR family regulator
MSVWRTRMNSHGSEFFWRRRPRLLPANGSSVVTAIAAERELSLTIPPLQLVAGRRLRYRPLTGTTELLSVGIARAKNADFPPAAEKLCEFLRKVSKVQENG